MDEIKIQLSEESTKNFSVRLIDQGSRKLIVIFSGASYSCDRPLLYYTAEGFLSEGYNALLIDSKFTLEKSWVEASKESRVIQAQKSAGVLFDELKELLRYDVIALAGKSIGSYLIASLQPQIQALNPSLVLWLTPVLYDKWSVLKENSFAKSVVIVGSKDSIYESHLHYFPENTMVIENADHSLEVESPLLSIEVLKRVIAKILPLAQL